ncbi:MAG: hypothetical protein WA634_02925 [Silvibacterium sp.]
MKRLIYCVLPTLLVGTPALCFARSPQAIGEMVHIGAATSKPVSPAPGGAISLRRAGRRSRAATNRTVKSGEVMNLHWGASEMRTSRAGARKSAQKGGAEQARPAFVIYGADSSDDSDSAAKTLKPQAAPAKTVSHSSKSG